MSSSDFSLTTFSRKGKLIQIEHALNAVEAGKISIGIKAKNGVVLCTEKPLRSILVDEKSIEKIKTASDSIGMIYSGMGPDYRVLCDKARKEAQSYFLTYKELIPTRVLVRNIAEVMQEFTQSGGVRPFGVSLLMAGYDDDGPQLFQVDPSGCYWGWKASAIGKNQKNAKTYLKKRYDPEHELSDAIDVALLTLGEGFEGTLKPSNLEVGVIDSETKKFRILSDSEVQDHLDDLE